MIEDEAGDDASGARLAALLLRALSWAPGDAAAARGVLGEIAS